MEDIITIIIDFSNLLTKVNFKRSSKRYYEYTYKYLKHINSYTCKQIGKTCDIELIKYCCGLGMNIKSILSGLCVNRKYVMGILTNHKNDGNIIYKIAKYGYLDELKYLQTYDIRMFRSCISNIQHGAIKNGNIKLIDYAMSFGNSLSRIDTKNIEALKHIIEKYGTLRNVCFNKIPYDCLLYLMSKEYKISRLDCNFSAGNKDPRLFMFLKDRYAYDRNAALYHSLNGSLEVFKYLLDYCNFGYAVSRFYNIKDKHKVKYLHEKYGLNLIGSLRSSSLEVVKYQYKNGVNFDNIGVHRYDTYVYLANKGVKVYTYENTENVIDSIDDYRLHNNEKEKNKNFINKIIQDSQ